MRSQFLRLKNLVAAIIAIAPLTIAMTSHDARAEEPLWHLEVGGAHAVGSPQSSEFGFGAGAIGAAEYPVQKMFGAQFELGLLGVGSGSAPSDPSLAAKSAGSLFTAMVGLRAHPMAEKDLAGLWIDADLGYALTGNLSRFAFDAHAGYEFRVGDPHVSRWDVGPFVGYTQIVQPDSALRPNDAHILWLGASVSLGRREEIHTPPPPLDRDHDGIIDDEDACPETPGIHTDNPKTNGCPRSDRDKDAIFDDEDACPDEPGIRTSDPKTNGCPRRDRDKDGIYDDEDACPDVPGIRTTDPKTNGCPRADRDNDAVFDNEDACPDVPGIRTTDPETNGCPPSEGHVRMMGDKIVLDEVILFDVDAARVRHVSWPIVQKVAAFIAKTPDVLEVDIEGYADAVGTPEHNLQLSRERAQAVKHLVVQFGVKAERLTTHAFGDAHPRVAVLKEEQANRRVEFTVTRSARGKGQVPAKGAKPGAPKPVSPTPSATPTPAARPGAAKP